MTRARTLILGPVAVLLAGLVSLTPPVTASEAPVGGAPPQGQIEPNRATTGITALPPVRILDTRTGLGGSRRVAAGRTVRLVVAGRGGVPTTAQGAILNLTAVAPSGGGYATIWPAGAARPTASTLNFARGQTVANLATVRLGTGGAVDIYVSGGPVDLLADLAGHLSPVGVTASAGRMRPLAPARLLDTRSRLGGSQPTGRGTVQLQVSGRATIPTNALAVVLNVTAVTPSGGGYLTVHPSGRTRPTASNLNFTRGVTRAARVIVPLGTGGRVAIYNGSSTATHLIADVAGYVVGSDGARVGSSGFVPMTPRRLHDSRSQGRPAPGQPLVLDADGIAGLPTMGVTALAVNVTVLSEDRAGYLTAYPPDRARPTASDLNFTAFATTPNLVVVKPSETGDLALWSSAPRVDIIVDVTGYFTGAFVVPATQWRSVVGSSYSRPATDGENILVGLSSRPAGDGATVRALNPTTGTVRWERRVEGLRLYEGITRAGVSGSSLMTTFPETTLAALTTQGAVQWETMHNTTVGNIAVSGDHYVVPFTETDGGISEGGVAVLDASDGSELWYRYGNYLTTNGGLVYFAEPASPFRAYRVADGTVAFDADPAIGIRAPVTAAGPRLLTTADASTGLYCSGQTVPEIGALSSTTGAVLWHHSLTRYSCAPTVHSPLVVGADVLYGTSAGLRRHDLATGRTLVAREQEAAPIALDPLVVHQGVLYATADSNPRGDDESGVFAYDPVTLDRLGLLTRGSGAIVLGGVLHVMDVDASGIASLVRLR